MPLFLPFSLSFTITYLSLYPYLSRLLLSFSTVYFSLSLSRFILSIILFLFLCYLIISFSFSVFLFPFVFSLVFIYLFLFVFLYFLILAFALIFSFFICMRLTLIKHNYLHCCNHQDRLLWSLEMIK